MDRSQADSRKYRSILLNNGLEALLISDVTTLKSAACMTVNAGAYSEGSLHLNEEAFPAGTAHLIEHLLFLGSRRYPRANTYDEAVKEGFGTQNAYTNTTYTTYYFDCMSSHFQGVLDLFSDFFTAPLFNLGDIRGITTLIEQEIKVVDEEHQNNKRNPAKIFDRGMAQFYNKTHPGRIMHDGNVALLSRAVRESCSRFFTTYYSAANMKLVVLDYAALSEMECTVRSKFSAIHTSSPNVDTKHLSSYGKMYPKDVEVYGHIVSSNPNIYKCRIVYEFPTFPLCAAYYFLPYLFNYRGTGSLFALLHARYLITSMGADIERKEDYTQLTVELNFTTMGWDRRARVIELVEEHLVLIKTALNTSDSSIAEFYNLHRDKSLLRHDTCAPAPPLQTVQAMSRDWVKGVSTTKLLSYHLWPEFDRKTTRLLVNFVKAVLESKRAVFFYAPAVPDCKYRTEKYYQLQYRKIPPLAPVKENLILTSLPQPPIQIQADSFICNLSTTVEALSLKPLFDDLEIYWSYSSVEAPSKMFICNISTLTYWSLSQAVTRGILFLSVKHALKVPLGDLYASGCNTSLEATSSGFTIQVTSSNTTLAAEAVKLITSTILTAGAKMTEESFVIFQEHYQLKLRKRQSLDMMEQTQDLLSERFLAGQHSYAHLLTASLEVSLRDVTSFDMVRYNTKVYGVVKGNVDHTSALKLAREVLPLLGKIKYELRPQLVPRDSNVYSVKSPQLKVGACRLAVRFGYVTRTSDGRGNYIMSMLRVLVRLLSQQYFYLLRTSEQLGYTVDCRVNHYGVDRDNTVTTCDFVTVSHTVSGDYLYRRTVKFLYDFYTYLSNIEEQHLKKLMSSLYEAEEFDAPEDLEDQTWGELEDIIKGDSGTAGANVSITKREVLNFYSQWFNVKSNPPWVIVIG